MSRFVVLGAGIAGMGAAYALSRAGHRPRVYDQRSHPGGHTASHLVDGFVVDEGPHVSFTKVERVRELLADHVEGRYETLQTCVDNYWRGHRVKHPVICNLHGLPTELVVDVVRDLVDAHRRPDDTAAASNFAEWLVACYGETYARTFPFEYNRKYHTADAERLSTDWLGPRLYRASLDEVLRGALEPRTPDVHYIDRFRYPTSGGFQAYLRPFEPCGEIVLDHRVTAIDPAKRRLTFAHGERAEYDQLISSVPLPDLIRCIDAAPAEVREATSKLACSTCVCVTVGVDRPDVTDAHWTYYYDRDVAFARTSAPHLFSPNNAPPGTSSIQCEVYFSDKYKPLDRSPEAIEAGVIADLGKVGLLREDDRLLMRDTRRFPYANVIFDHDRKPALGVVHGYLDEIGVRYCGRYGDWGYLWTDDSLLSGERAAGAALASA